MSAQQEYIDPMSPIITEQEINTEGTGPYCVYSPGFTFVGLKNMTYLFNKIPGGQIFQIKSGTQWTGKGMLPDGAATRKRTVKNPFTGTTIDEHESREIPAQSTLNALLSDRSLTGMGLTQIIGLDVVDVAHETFNLLINPEIVIDMSKPASPNWRKIADAEGILKLRLIWLESALEALDTGRMLVDVANVIDRKPYLQDLWRDAIRNTLIPSNESFNIIANTNLAQVEERIRAGQQQVYDGYAQTLMWLLGRKPERTALSRTLEDKGKNGLGYEEIKAIVEGMMGTKQAAAPAVEQMQCPDCGEFINTVAGGPPRRCRYCQHEFSSSTVIARPDLTPQTPIIVASQAPVEVEIVEEDIKPQQPEVDPEIQAIIDRVQGQMNSKR